jgi:uncharacterized protein YigE (DUF2233 family)
MRAKFRLFPAQLITVVALLGGCFNPGSATPVSVPTATLSNPDAAWETLAPGFERRFYRPGGDYPLTQFVALRIDPALYAFRVHYRPGAPLALDGWRDQLPGAVTFANANFFDTERRALGLVVADGVPYGQAFQGMGGMLQVQNNGVRVRSTILEPYASEPLEQAVQAFPMLITNGQASFSNTQGDRISRRTLVGQDTLGRIVLMANSSLVGIRLVDLSSYLATTDLNLVNAVNLDGGGSTMLAMSVPGQQSYQILSLDPVPTVLAVYPR